MAQGNFDKALRNLSNDVSIFKLKFHYFDFSMFDYFLKIYYSSEIFGTEDYRVSGGYFLMGNIFFKMEKMDVADSLYRQVTNTKNHILTKNNKQAIILYFKI